MGDIVNATILTVDMKHAQEIGVLCVINEEWYMCVCVRVFVIVFDFIILMSLFITLVII